MINNLVSIDESIKDHWLWSSEKEFGRFQAWMDLVVSASEGDESNLMYCFPVESRKKGEAVTSIRTLMKNWNWSRGRVVRFLGILQEAGAAKVTKKGKMLVIEILDAGCGMVI